ncbi:MAG: beta-methylgalactoside transporter [Clostridiaceae bacterium]|jgi:methyl-galactoside transport system permease protein|nr:beta-methylgalactoside transporter [Bacillota bacterium]NLN52554.1 beta-methylgalactoside transporter [Clostridiaceae bacterium]
MSEGKILKKDDFNFGAFLVNNALVLVAVVMVIFTALFADNFLTFNNLKNIIANTSLRAVIALGVSGCLIIRGTDLSAGRVVGITSVLSALMLQRPDAASEILYPGLAGSPIIAALAASMTLGLVFGLINGMIVALLKVPAFIATLGTQIAIYGLNMLLSQNVPIGSLNQNYADFGRSGLQLGPLVLPWLFFVAALVSLFMHVLYKRTTHGKYMYAIGGNEIAAEVSGVNTSKTKIMIFALAGALYGLAGFLLTAKTGSSAVGAGTGYELEAIAAATIGGVSTAGGIGTVPGVFLGVLVFELLKACLQFLGVPPEFTNIFQGLVIVAAVALDIRKTMRKK